jgi:Xaa-Pro aminopeptidase
MHEGPPYRRHRERFLQELARAGAAAVIPTATPKVRNHDSEYRFRPDSDFWYLTGFAEPGCVLVLLPPRPGAPPGPRSVLFLRERKRDEEIWTGRRLGVEAAPAELGIDQAFPIGELWSRLAGLLRGYARVVYRAGLDEARDRELLAVLARLRRDVRSAEPLFEGLVDTAPLLHELRLIKGEDELERMRRAAAISAEAHQEALREARPGEREYEVEARIEACFRRLGSTGSAYVPIVASGANACILHYHENQAELREGELLLVDAGAECDYYASDVTRTFPIGGSFSEAQGQLYEVVLRAQERAIALVRSGETIQSVHDAAVRALAEGLMRLELVGGPLERILEEETYRRFYMHRTSHWLGLDVHDCGAYTLAGNPRPLEPGMVLTVEPGLYVDPGEAEVDERWRGIGIRIEDDVLVTPEGCEVLTAAIPKRPAELARERG